MMKAYNQQNHQITRQSHYTKNSFLPLICRASINDVKLSDFKDHSFSSFSGDPSSPKVTCMGQIKRNSKLIIPFPATTTYRLESSSPTTTSSSAAHITTKANGQAVKYITLKKWFSAKNFTTNVPTSTTAAAAYGGGVSCRGGGKEMRSYVNSRRSSKINNDEGNNNQQEGGHVIRVNFNELDPPLPVIKKAAQPPSEVNLWNRRSGGMALKSLQIKQQINLPNNNNRCEPAPPTV